VAPDDDHGAVQPGELAETGRYEDATLAVQFDWQ
jgi:hypothetical protein